MALQPQPGAVIVERPEWRRWVTPKPLLEAPVHRWFVFPHSFSGELVEALAEEWGLSSEDVLVDPFVGAGTTLVAARALGIPSVGFDLSPLAIFASSVKAQGAERSQVERAWRSIRRTVRPRKRLPRGTEYDELIHRAFSPTMLATIHATKETVLHADSGEDERRLMLLALLRILPRFSLLVQKGGWLTEAAEPLPVDRFRDELARQVQLMLLDLQSYKHPETPSLALRADARSLPLKTGAASAVITSPPYANRHDYTRVFGVELLFGFLDWKATRALRYQSFRSHPEARAPSLPADGYVEPARLRKLVDEIEVKITDPRAKYRIPVMLRGYFEDLYLALKEISRILTPSRNAAVVLGNVQYCGIPLEVDHYAAEFGSLVGLEPAEVRVARYRGNSAQQMKLYGRNPARESVVIFRRAC